MYVAVKGGEKAISEAHRQLSEKRRGDQAVETLSIAQIRQQLPYAVDRVMTEGSLYDPQLAALAIKQAAGDLIEAIFLLRAYRTTLPKIQSSQQIDSSNMQVERRISATFKDIPGGQILGPTFDYTHRMLDFSLLDDAEVSDNLQTDEEKGAQAESDSSVQNFPQVLQLLEKEGLIEQESSDRHHAGSDITQEPLTYPANRSERLQALARGDEGFLLALGYSTQRGYGRTHPFAGEIRIGSVELEIIPEELGFPITIGELTVTECQQINQFNGSKTKPPQFTRGYGLAFGHNERKAMAMALVDRALRADEFDETRSSPAQDEEFVLSHADNVEAVGFVSHLKLPHYVDFQSELELIRKLRSEAEQRLESQSDD